jgi:hypothetical protein
MNMDKQQERLLKMKQYLGRVHKLQITPEHTCNFRIEYLNVSEMINIGTRQETVRIVPLIVGGYILLADEKIAWPVDDDIRHMLNHCEGSHLYFLSQRIRHYVESIVATFGYNHVHVDKYDFIDESDSN